MVTAAEIEEIERHKYFLSEQHGCDVGWEVAVTDWEEKFGEAWRAVNAELYRKAASARSESEGGVIHLGLRKPSAPTENRSVVSKSSAPTGTAEPEKEKAAASTEVSQSAPLRWIAPDALPGALPGFTLPWWSTISEPAWEEWIRPFWAKKALPFGAKVCRWAKPHLRRAVARVRRWLPGRKL